MPAAAVRRSLQVATVEPPPRVRLATITADDQEGRRPTHLGFPVQLARSQNNQREHTLGLVHGAIAPSSHGGSSRSNRALRSTPMGGCSPPPTCPRSPTGIKWHARLSDPTPLERPQTSQAEFLGTARGDATRPSSRRRTVGERRGGAAGRRHVTLALTAARRCSRLATRAAGVLERLLDEAAGGGGGLASAMEISPSSRGTSPSAAAMASDTAGGGISSLPPSPPPMPTATASSALRNSACSCARRRASKAGRSARRRCASGLTSTTPTGRGR